MYRKILISTIFLLISGFGVSGSRSDAGSIETELSSYGEALYVAIFALSETRPFAILQFDRFIEVRDESWLTARNAASDLSNREKTALLEKLSEYVDSQPAGRKDSIIKKLKSASSAVEQIRLLSSNFDPSAETVIAALLALPRLSALSEEYRKENGIATEDIDAAFDEALEIISEKSEAEQLAIYSDLCSKLSEVCAK